MCSIFWAGQKRAITELKPLLGWSNFDRSETSHDRAKTCLAGQHDWPLSKTYSKPHPLSSSHSKGDYQSYCWPYSTWLPVCNWNLNGADIPYTCTKAAGGGGGGS